MVRASSADRATSLVTLVARPGLSVAVAAALAAFMSVGACKPGTGGKAQQEPGNVFTLAGGSYEFVSGTLQEGKEGARPVAVEGGTGKRVTVVTVPGGAFKFTHVGKYVWKLPGSTALNVDCTAQQDQVSFSVYSVEGGVGKLGSPKVEPGCKFDPESTDASLRTWKPMLLAPNAAGGFVLTQEATAGGKKLTLVETYSRSASN